MSNIIGYGGKSGGTGNVAQEAPNTLKSKAFANIIDVVCEGEIEGLVNGEQSIYLNEVPVQDSLGNINFDGYSYTFKPGTQSQAFVPGFDKAASSTTVGTELKYNKHTIINITDTNVDAVDIVVAVASLTNQDKSNGDLNGHQVSYRIAYKGTSDVSFVTAVDDTIAGKTVTRYQRSTRVVLGSDFPYKIRVERLSPKTTSVSIQDNLFFDLYTQVIFAKLAYPNSAYNAFSVDAEHFSSIPKRAYHLKLLKIQIPTNYDPLTRIYTGIWDGTFKTAWSDNPAWCFYDMVSNKRYGLGEYIDFNHIDKWALYTIGKYCDELVDDGFGGLEPRFTCNLYLQSRQEAYQVLRDMSSIFRGITFWGGETLLSVQDAPTSPVAVFTNSNVIDGAFTYSGTSDKTRHNVALVTWNDPADFYRQKIEYVEDQVNIAERGKIVETGLIAIGATSRGQAHRLGRWTLFTEKLERNVLVFKTSLEGANVRPGEVIRVTDNFKANRRLGGRILDVVSRTVLTLDNELLAEFTGTHSDYNISFQTQKAEVVPAGDPLDTANTKVSNNVEVYTANIASISATTLNGDTKVQVVLASPIPSSLIPANGSTFIITQDALIPEVLYKVVSMVEEEPGIYGIVCLEHDANKFNLIESDYAFEDRPLATAYANIPGVPSAPTNVQITSRAINTLYGPSISTIISWDESNVPSSYTIYLKKASEDWTILESRYGQTFIEIFDLKEDFYTAKVIAIGDNNLASVAAESAITLVSIQDTLLSMPPVSGLELFNGYNSNDFFGNEAQIVWRETSTSNNLELDDTLDFGADSGVPDTFFKDYEIRVFDNNDNLLRVEHTLDTSYIYTLDKHITDGGPFRTVKIEVYQRGTFNQISDSAAKIVVSNPQIGILSNVKVEATLSTIHVSANRPTELDFSGMLVYLSTSPNFTKDSNTQVADIGNDTSAFIQGLDRGTYYVSVAAYDTWDKTSLSFSAEISISVNQQKELLSEISSSIAESEFTQAFNNRLTGTDASISSNSTNIALNSAEFTTKIDYEGHIVGLGASVVGGASGPVTSQFLIQSDQFAILTPAPVWSASKAFVLGQLTKPTVDTGFYYDISVAGTTGTTEPIWPTIGGDTIVDGTITWRTVSKETAVPFFIDRSSGEPAIGMNGNLIVDGTITAGALAADSVNATNILVDNLTSIISDIGEATAGRIRSADGTFDINLNTKEIIIAGPLGAALDNYVYINNGQLTFYTFRNGIHTVDKAVTRRVSGVANSGDIVNIPGFFSSQPEIILSAKSLKLYDHLFSNQDQTANLDALLVTEYATDQWRFTAKAELQLGSASGNVVLNDTSGTISADTFTSTVYTTPANNTSIQVNIQFTSNRSTGTSPNYFNRTIQARLGYRVALSASTYTYTAYKTTNMGGDFNTYLDTIVVSGLPQNSYEFIIEYISSDTGTTFSSGTILYDFDSQNVAQLDTNWVISDYTVIQTSAPTAPAGDESRVIGKSLNVFTPAAGWEITSIDYTIGYDYYFEGTANSGGLSKLSLWTDVVANPTLGFSDVIGSPANLVQKLYFNTAFGSGSPALQQTTALNVDQFTITYNKVTSTFVQNANLTQQAYAEDTFHYVTSRNRVGISSCSAVVNLRRPQGSTTIPNNTFNIIDYNYTLASATVLASGTLNWTAIGD